MSKFNTAHARTNVHAPITASRAEGKRTFQGGQAFSRDARSELFVLAVANMVAERTFYESASSRDARFESLVAQVAVEDPMWMKAFLPWLRNEANMRSASLVGALEAVRALCLTTCDAARCTKQPEFVSVEEGNRLRCKEHTFATCAPIGRREMIASVLQRADEPGEALAYWLGKYGRPLPDALKRGVMDAATRLYRDKSAMKYDTPSHSVRFADVVELCHPNPKAAWRSDLFKWLLDRRPGRRRKVGGKHVETPTSLRAVAARDRLREAVKVDKSALLDAEALDAAGVTWEQALSEAGKDVDKAALWEAKIPSMGYMALLRNLKGFDEAGISDAVAAQVAARIADPDEVKRSKQFPFRFLSAWRAVPSMRWAQPLETALGYSLQNVPALPGRTLILVDQSGSMFWANAAHSAVKLSEIAAVFGSALALRAEHARLVQYGSNSERVQFAPGVGSLLRVAERFHDMGGTNTAAAVNAHYAGHDRVIIITDEQTSQSYGYSVTGHLVGPGDLVPKDIPMYTWNLAGYQYGHDVAGAHRRYTFGGLTDQAWSAIELLEAGHNGQWPF